MTLSQTLFGNPKGPVELGNPNTYKAVSKFYFILAQESCYKPEDFGTVG